MYKKILVPTDGSPLSRQAAREAVELARLYGAGIVAFAVAEPYPMMPAAEGAMVIDPGIEVEALRTHAQVSVDEVAQLARAAGVPVETATSCSMLPAEDIVGAGARHGCDLIFMASHGRRGLSRLLAGSVTQNVLAIATIPVMVLHPRPRDQGAAP
jgi:nucleotide-binding universal stress UspA family protein